MIEGNKEYYICNLDMVTFSIWIPFKNIYYLNLSRLQNMPLRYANINIDKDNWCIYYVIVHGSI